MCTEYTSTLFLVTTYLLILSLCHSEHSEDELLRTLSEKRKQRQEVYRFPKQLPQGGINKKTAEDYSTAAFSWTTRTRTWKNRTRICCVTITP